MRGIRGGAQVTLASSVSRPLRSETRIPRKTKIETMLEHTGSMGSLKVHTFTATRKNETRVLNVGLAT